jgi:hypothetical protein
MGEDASINGFPIVGMPPLTSLPSAHAAANCCNGNPASDDAVATVHFLHRLAVSSHACEDDSDHGPFLPDPIYIHMDPSLLINSQPAAQSHGHWQCTHGNGYFQ